MCALVGMSYVCMYVDDITHKSDTPFSGDSGLLGQKGEGICVSIHADLKKNKLGSAAEHVLFFFLQVIADFQGFQVRLKTKPSQ